MAAIGGFPGQSWQTEGRLRVGSPEYLAKYGHGERCEVEGCDRPQDHYPTSRFPSVTEAD